MAWAYTWQAVTNLLSAEEPLTLASVKMSKPLAEIHCNSVRKDGAGEMDIVIGYPQRSAERGGDFSCRVQCDAIDFRIDARGFVPQDAVKNAMLLMALRVGHALADEITDVLGTDECDFS